MKQTAARRGRDGHLRDPSARPGGAVATLRDTRWYLWGCPPPHCATISGGSVAGEGSGSALGRGWGRPRLELGALEQSGDAGSPPQQQSPPNAGPL